MCRKPERASGGPAKLPDTPKINLKKAFSPMNNPLVSRKSESIEEYFLHIDILYRFRSVDEHNA